MYIYIILYKRIVYCRCRETNRNIKSRNIGKIYFLFLSDEGPTLEMC